MSKKTSPARNSSQPDFAWARDSGFTPPKQDGRTIPHLKLAPATPQVSNLNPLLEEFLKPLLVAVKENAGIIRILPPHGQALQPVSAVGLPAKLLEAESPFDLSCETCGKAAIGRGIYIEDISSCESRLDCRYTGCQFQSIIAAPLTDDNAPVNPAGILTLYFNNPQQPNDHISKTVLSFARLISAIFEHNKSNQDAKRIDLMAERQAIANEIHDSLAQTLVYTRMRTSLLLESIRTGNELMSAKYAHDIDDALESSQKTVRELITDFRCAMDPSGLLNALQTLTEQFCHRNEIALEYINRVAHLELPLEYEIQVFHIVQEALANIATHSGATPARLIVGFFDQECLSTIKDNGSGGCTLTPVESHYGMLIMRQRPQRIG